MRIYFCHKERNLVLADPKQGAGAWLEFTDQPLAGYGDVVYTTDIPEGLLEKYEFTHSERNLIQGVRYFDIPATDLRRYNIEQTSYRRITGRPWNQWIIMLKPATPDVANTTSRVWSSRADAVTALRVESPKHDQQIQITLSPNFDPEEDYLVLETRQKFPKGPKWNLELLVGAVPDWVDFPAVWGEWVHQEAVQDSAVEFLKEKFPEAAAEIAMAHATEERSAKGNAWRAVNREMERLMGESLGQITVGSWTSTLALPIKLAERVGGWIPPIRRPEYVDPETSGRVCVAAPAKTKVLGTNFISRTVGRRTDDVYHEG